MSTPAKGKPVVQTPLLGFTLDPLSRTGLAPVFGPPASMPGFKLLDGRASYGVGRETFALGFAVHFDWGVAHVAIAALGPGCCERVGEPERDERLPPHADL